MNIGYALAEFFHRPVRAAISIASIALGIAVFVSLQAFSEGYRKAARAPLSEIGADLVVQRQGDIPEKFEGIIFPHSVAPIHKEEIAGILKIPGVEAIAQAVFFWSFEQDSFVAGLGINAADTFGPGRLTAAIVSGRFPEPGESGVAVADTTYAMQSGYSLGSIVRFSGETFRVIGLADTTRVGQLANANLYIPLADAQRLVNAAPQVRAVHPIRPDDANMLFVKVNQLRAAGAAEEIGRELAGKITVTTARTFAAELGMLFTFVDRFGSAVGTLAFLFAAGVLVRLVLGGIWERRKEIALMRSVGWKKSDITQQLFIETGFLALAGCAAGMAISWLAIGLMSMTRISVPVPWELSPSPHFLPGGARAFSVTIGLPVNMSADLFFKALGLIAITLILTTVFMMRRLSNIKPAEVLRAE